jgi:hypothetical protein
MHVQPRIERTAHPMAVRRGDPTAGVLEPRPARSATHERRRGLQVDERRRSVARTASSPASTSLAETSAGTTANNTLTDFGAENVKWNAVALGPLTQPATARLPPLNRNPPADR